MDNDLKLFKVFLLGFLVVILLFFGFSTFAQISPSPIKVLDSEIKSQVVDYVYEGSLDINNNYLDKVETSRTDHSINYDLGNGHFITKVYPGVAFTGFDYKTIVERATTTIDNFNKNILSSDLSFISSVQATSYYPNFDGWIYNSGSNWSDARDASSGDSVDTTGEIIITTGIYTSLPEIRRSFLAFPTYDLPDNAVIASSTFLYKVSSTPANGDNDGNDYLALVSSTHSSSTSLLVDDFDTASSTLASSATTDISTISSGNWYSFLLNANGTSTISTTGYSKFALREGHDFLNNAYNGSNNTWNQVNIYSLDATGSSNDPYLLLEWFYPASTTATSTATSTLVCEYNDEDDEDVILAYLNFWWQWPLVLGVIMLAFYFLRSMARKLFSSSI